jgi:hypothetical protein
MRKFILLYVFCLSSFASFAQNYLLGRSKDGVEELYIMSVTTSRMTESIVVFDRVKPVSGKLSEFRHNAKMDADKEVDTKDFEKLGYFRRKIQYSCQARKYRIMECTYYELGGKVLEKVTFDEDERQWSVLPKGSLIEAEFKKVCKK